MYNIKWFTCFFLICISPVRFGVANDFPHNFKLLYNSSNPDEIQFNLTSDHDRFHIKTIKCGSSSYYSGEKSTASIKLAPCKHYECIVEVENQYTNEKLFQTKYITTGFHRDTLPIKLLRVIPEPNSIRIELDFHQIDCIDSFYIVLDNSKVLLWSKYNLTKSLQISSLSPCVQYYMFVLFNHQSRPYTILNEVVRTTSLELRRIDKIVFDSKTGLLKWTPVFFDNCTSKYVITITSDTSDKKSLFETERNEYNLNFLENCSKFVIGIKPKKYDALFANIHIETGYKNPPQSIQNIRVNMLDNISALSIKWEKSACFIEYAIQINGVWTTTTSAELVVPVCNNSTSFNISVCVEQWHSANNCVNYNFDGNSHKLVAGSDHWTDSRQIPSLFRLNGWGSVTMHDFNDKDALLQIKHNISSLSDSSNFTLIISELACGTHLVPSYKIFDPNIGDDECTHLVTDDCTIICEFNKIPNEVQLSVTEGISFSCASADRKHIALKRGVEYEIMARIFTPTGYIDTSPMVFPKDRVLAYKLNIILYISLAVACTTSLLILIVIRLFCQKYHCHPRRATVNNLTPARATLSSPAVVQDKPIDLSLYKDLLNF